MRDVLSTRRADGPQLALTMVAAADAVVGVGSSGSPAAQDYCVIETPNGVTEEARDTRARRR
jgi:glutamine phosphoribosylpyrophosphate amidotransferase